MSFDLLFPPSYVRQAVLCALSTVAVATPTSCLLTEMEGALSEAVQWAQGQSACTMHDELPDELPDTLPPPPSDVCSSDADDEARALAKHTLSLVGAAVREEACGETD